MSSDSGASRRSISADVVVVGFGNAGIAAAITAHDLGAEVIVLEKMPEAESGGNSRVSGQVWFSPDDVELSKEYLRGLSNGMPVADDVLQVWAEETSKNTDWLVARGEETHGIVERDPLDSYPQGLDVTQITYGDEMLRQTGWKATRDEFPEFNNEGGTDYFYIGPDQGHSRLWQTLRAALHKRDIKVLYDTRATALVQDVDGRVVGIEADDSDGPLGLTARRGVVLAAGGFGNNQEMVRTYLGLPYASPWGSPGNTGDGILLGQKIGADLQNMYNYMPFFGIRIPGKDIGEFVQPPGLGFMHVRKDGRRFVDETTSYRHGKSVIGGALEFFPTSAMWTVFDDETRAGGPMAMTRKQFSGGWLKQVHRYTWSDDNLTEIEAGWITRADTIRELAEKLGVDPDGLEAEVERYNGFAEAGEDVVFGRPAAAMAPIKTGPFYGYAWGNVMITTLGGLRKDGRARVIDVEGEPIPGLYTAGEMSSTYTWALSGGQSIGDAIAFGRVAGREVAAAKS